MPTWVRGPAGGTTDGPEGWGAELAEIRLGFGVVSRSNPEGNSGAEGSSDPDGNGALSCAGADVPQSASISALDARTPATSADSTTPA